MKLSIFNTYGTVISELDIKVYEMYDSCVHKNDPLLLHIAIPDHILMVKWILLTSNIQVFVLVITNQILGAEVYITQ